MINRLLTFALFLAVFLLLQLLLAPLVDVNGVRPDFLLVAALLAVLFLDRFYGLLAAFCIGILSDGLSAVPIASHALAYTWGALLVGWLRRFDFAQGFNYSAIMISGILLSRTLLIWLIVLSSDWDFTRLFFAKIIPESLFTFAFAGILFQFLKVRLLALQEV
jgi:rod shape-determining protein MreD